MANKPLSLVLATGNAGKILELRQLLAELPLELRSLRDFPDIRDIDETGTTYRENAELKARGFAQQTGQMSLADDSGLEVAALGDAPGVYSARFAGAATGYDVKIPKLLSMLAETGDTDRAARFVCVASVADRDGSILYSAEGICSGTIAHHPRGDGGFGYDPIFVPEGHTRTFGELPEEVKHEISHRARAARLIIRYLLDFIAVRT
jgi:XTP/dITP diphosphohydrolase